MISSSPLQRSANPVRRMIALALFVVMLIVGVVLAVQSGRDVGTLISIFTTRFLGILIEALPFLLLGALASGLIDSFVTADDIARIIPRNAVGGTLVGSVMGFAFPVCECGVVPVVRRLYMKGLPLAVGVAFLLAAPVINPVVLVSTYAAFGFGAILIGRFALTLIISVIVGLVFAAVAKPGEVLRPSMPRTFATVAGGSPDAALSDIYGSMPIESGRPTLAVGLRNTMSMAIDEFFDMGRYLVIGSLLAAGMQTLIPQEWLTSLGSGPVLSVLVLMGLAFLLSVCSTVDAFLALAFVGTFTPGAIIAFLVFGPMVDIKSTLMFSGVFKRRTVAYLVILPFVLTALFGIWINLNIPL
jgi:uncharacterized protein